jgi:SNF2 family DNA or RNA helicase
MKILRAGMFVNARRRRWRVVEARAFDDCQLITLSGLGPGNAGHETSLLAPFDSIEPIQETVRPKRVRPARWRRACRRLLMDAFSDEQLREAARARIDLLPHQLEPAIALVRGHGCRVLLADAVGMGKTIQAGLALAELRARGMADRVLIVTPAGLRDQWADELARRFAIEAAVMDFRGVARRVSSLPHDVNPWTTVPVAIASIDYVKRAEVLSAVAACRWEAIVVDEAHGLAGDSDRHEAVAALAARTAYVILLTATPHNGDARGFRSLCAIGGEQRPLLVFRRDRDALRTLSSRRVHRLLVRPSLEERQMHAALADFTRAVRAEHESADREMWLAMAVLHKRAYSSAQALERTVARRLAAIDPGWHPAEQLELPLESSSDADPLDAAPAWHPALRLRDRAHERHLLTVLREAAVAATAHESKLLALGRLLRRIREPVIVFTEFRDTLLHVAQSIDRPAALLHGGLSRQERLDALRAFSSGSRAILLATDAAGEGLNLQQTCRTVINLELPWNPMRLEQRIGRVDRIGQHRTVHAFHLIAADTGEHRLLSSLRLRIARARADIGAPDPLGDEPSTRQISDGEDRIAQLVIAGTPLSQSAFDETSEWRGPEAVASCHEAAMAEARRLEASRVLVHPYRDSDRATGFRDRSTTVRWLEWLATP